MRRPVEGDFSDVLALVQAYDRSMFGETDWTAAELRDEWRDVDLDRDAWVIELGDAIAGYTTFRDRGGGTLLADGYVHPDARGRGVGGAILTVTEERAREAAAGASPSERIVLRNATLLAPDGDAADALYESHGYAAVRHFWRMVADLDREPASPRAPDGVAIEPYAHERDARAVHAAIQEAFTDHWEHRHVPWEDWERERLGRSGFDPTLWLVARSRDEVAGAALVSWKTSGDWGFVDTIGVRRPWRGRGVGEALLRSAFRELWLRGERRVALGVDAQSPTGATRLYERVGMTVLWRAVVWEKELRAEVATGRAPDARAAAP
ncbi:MAG: GNAT family N-acetyltransferase [Thermoleophilia bacterium]|nr:GNAT family N-acetyltransferase [Thermoleophilia bacterium]